MDFGHLDMIDSLLYIPDRHWLVSAGRDNNIVVWKLVGERVIRNIIEQDDQNSSEDSLNLKYKKYES